MNLIKKNEMDPELVRQLMEHSGYEVVKEAVEDVAPESEIMNLDESTTAILESVIFDDVEYLLGESFVDEESGEVFVHLSIQEENDSE